MSPNIRRCTDDDVAEMVSIINEAAEAYRGIIPVDRWHEPYMPEAELRDEIAAGVEFLGCEDERGDLIGVMGVQPVQDVSLIRHAYVRPAAQGTGVGGALIAAITEMTDRPLLVGTWAAAGWAIKFYEKHGFTLVTPNQKESLLRKYWSIPDRQIETSVVLADQRWFNYVAVY
ncbi:MAG: GNAT family N-acetyltransferase [Proteobacteria bacterium]|nr:GNAT family N-acetyltransferase [Pseudomonadota bacterium]